ncbi:phosphotransferase family protein [Millisia brevis]|uniref:phosphotransferase family protein n=1 Tax=Millisia brevis TaxID=264148 RepID=UPI00082F119C|nr:phosphotransferase family protein [Millisia brevis]
MTAATPPTSTDLAGLDLPALDAHLREIGVARSGELTGRLLSGGRSNLTFLVADDASRWVLRRPPLSGLTPSAHDVAREYRVVDALGSTAVPVAPTVTVDAEGTVLGAPFAMVAYVDGRVIRTADDLAGVPAAQVSPTIDALVTTLSDLHAVDPAAVGLGDFGRPEGYLARQVRRWGSQWQHVRFDDDTRDNDVSTLHDRLVEALPEQQGTSIVHGDYRIDNVMVDHDEPTTILAVVDWELSTLGDPLSDVALMCVYRDPDFDDVLGLAAAWTSPALPSADDIAQRYAARSGRDLVGWPFYLALGYFKLAIIAAGIDHRRRTAEGAGRSADAEAPDRVGASVAPLLATGLRIISG